MERKYQFACTPSFIGSPNGAFKIGLLFLVRFICYQISFSKQDILDEQQMEFVKHYKDPSLQ
jgi:hypothetical protein